MKITREELLGTGKNIYVVQIQEYIGGNEFEEDVTKDYWLADDYNHLMEQLAEQNVYHLSGEFDKYDWDPRKKEDIDYGKEGRTGADFETSLDEHWGTNDIDCLGEFKEAKSYEIRLVEVEKDEDDEDEDDEDYDDEDEDED
jgi:hypothetical protein